MKGDTISRKAIKEYIKLSDLTNKEKMALHIAINNINTVDAAPKWISVNDRLPEFGDTAVIRFDGKTDIATYWRGELCPHWRGQWYGTIYLGSVTHWMPLPEPPEMDAEEGAGE